MSDKDKINKLYWDTYNEYTIGRGDPIKGHELAMVAIEKEIRNQALKEAADICSHISTGAMIAKDKNGSSDYLEGLVKGADDCEKAIRAKIGN